MSTNSASGTATTHGSRPRRRGDCENDLDDDLTDDVAGEGIDVVDSDLVGSDSALSASVGLPAFDAVRYTATVVPELDTLHVMI